MPPSLRLTSNLPVASLHERAQMPHTRPEWGVTNRWVGRTLDRTLLVGVLLSSSNSLLPCRDAGPRLPDQILQWKPEIQTLLQHLLALSIGYKSYIKKKKKIQS